MEEDKSIKVKKILKKCTKFISYSLICILMIISSFMIFYFVTTKIYKENGKNPPFALYTVVSSSMEPSINVYDVVFIKKVDSDKLKENDIITFYSSNTFFGNTPITHRIVEVIKEDGIKFRVKGDANKIEDEELVLSENILGRVYFKLPGFGKIQFFLASKWGLLLAILIPAIIILFYDIFKVGKVVYVNKKLKEIEELENN